MTKRSNTDGLCCHSPSTDETVIRGREAMARQRRRWDDWLIIAEALDAGRAEVMRDVHTNQPTGRRYEKAMGEWLLANGFKEIDKGARCRLFECLTHRQEIEGWRARLTESERFKFNHPDAVLRKWKATTVTSDLNKPKPPPPFAKLQDAHVQLIEEHHRLQREIERGGGDLWGAKDTAEDIATVMVAKLHPVKAEMTARAMLTIIKEQKAKKRETAKKRAQMMQEAMPVDLGVPELSSS